MNNYFYIDIDEEITSVIGRLRKDNSEEVFLVVPKRAIIAQSLVNLRLLEKESNKLNKKLIFVSPDPQTRKIAEKAGLSVKKYIAKPKEKKGEEIKQSFGKEMPSQKVSLEPWEEAAAKEELKKAMHGIEQGGENESQERSSRETRVPFGGTLIAPPPTMGGPALMGPPATKIKAGTFSSASKLAPLPSANSENQQKKTKKEAKPQIIDLKKIASLKKEKKINDEKKKNTNLTDLAEEPSLKEMINTDQAENNGSENQSEITDQKEVKTLPIVHKSPFRIKKINQVSKEVIRPALQAVVLEKSNPLPSKQDSDININKPTQVDIVKQQSDSGVLLEKPNVANEQALNSEANRDSSENSKDKSSQVLNQQQKENILPNVATERLDRETINLTVREKEKLRNLWMEQKKVVFGRTVQDNTLIDLKPQHNSVSSRNESLEQSKGIFQTTHRKVVGPGKIIDLRRSASPLAFLPKFSKNPQNNKKGSEIILPLFNVRLFLSFVIGILAILIIIMGIILPEAKLSLTPKKSVDNFQMKALVSGETSEVNFDQRMIPGKPIHFQISEEKSFESSAQKQVTGSSEGQIVVYNKSNEPLSLKQNALFKDKEGNKYYSTASITIPAAKQSSDNTNSNDNSSTVSGGEPTPGSAIVRITGDEKNNLKQGSSLDIPSLDEGDYAGLITAEVKKDFISNESKTVKILSQEDLDKAKEELLNKAHEESKGEIKKYIDEELVNFINVDQLTEENVSFETDKKVGEEAVMFNAKLTITFFTVAFSPKDLQNLAKNIVEKDREDKEGTINILSYQVTDADPLENKIGIDASMDYEIISKVDVQEIQKYLVAKKKQEVMDYLKGRSDIETFDLSIWPSIFGHMPFLDKRIKIELR